MRRLNSLLTSFLGRHESAIAAAVMATGVVVLTSGLIQPQATCVTGDMRVRYDARVPQELAEAYLDAEQMDIGFGAAAVGGWEGLGDALVVGGNVFVRHTNRASPRYYQIAVNRYFQSNAFVYVPAQRAPETRYRIESSRRMDRLLEELAHDYPQGVIAAGALRFAPLKIIAMSAPAIGGEPVTQRAVRYYTRPTETAAESWAYVVLLAARDDDGSLATILPPAVVRTLPAGQALALRLPAAPVEPWRSFFSSNAVSVGQLLKDAIVVEGELTLYPIAHAQPCTVAEVTSLH